MREQPLAGNAKRLELALEAAIAAFREALSSPYMTPSLIASSPTPAPAAKAKAATGKSKQRSKRRLTNRRGSGRKPPASAAAAGPTPVAEASPLLTSGLSDQPATSSTPQLLIPRVPALFQKRQADPHRAEVFAALAATLAKEVERRSHPPSKPVNTAKKVAEIEVRERDARAFARSLALVQVLQAGHEKGTLPLLLQRIRSKAQIDWLCRTALLLDLDEATAKTLGFDSFAIKDEQELQELMATGLQSLGYQGDLRRMLKTCGIVNLAQLKFVLEQVQEMVPRPNQETLTRLEITRLRRAIIGRRIPGFFPTPLQVLEKMLSYIKLTNGHRILEPSAGYGSIAEAVLNLARQQKVQVQIDAVEKDLDLRQILELMGLNLIGRDFLDLVPPKKLYNAILMNPPFEGDAYIKHIQHAKQFLAPGGVLVAIAANNWTHEVADPKMPSQKRHAAFQNWLRGQNAKWEKLPNGSFKASEISTGVATTLIVIK